jgi:hypothetical protein
MKIHQVKEDQFINPTTPLAVYMIGLLWADGYILPPYVVTLTTTYPDAKYFIPLFLKTGKWKYYDKIFENHPNWKINCNIKTSNKHLVEFLVKNDYESKSYKSANKILSTIPQNLKHYWFRGLLDGDGYIHTDNKGCHRISFSSNIHQDWNYLESLCKELNLQYHILKDDRNNHISSVFSVSGKYKVLKLCEFIYNNFDEDQIGLKRKHDKFLQLKSTEEKNRYRGVSQKKNGMWRAYTSGAKRIKPKHLGVFFKKEDALKCVENFYSINPKLFLS